MTGEEFDSNVGLPEDLCPAWLAVGPVPAGKRCMAVTFSPSKNKKRGRGAYGEGWVYNMQRCLT